MRANDSRLVGAIRRCVSDALVEHDLAGRRILVALSGGPDSLTLLHALHSARNDCGLTLCGAHLNHRLRGAESDADAEFAASTFAQIGIPFTCESADVAAYRDKRRLSLEDAARQVRYAFLADAAERHGADAIALGHTADDQAETVLMHIIRGSGLDGIRGMQTLDTHRIAGVSERKGDGKDKDTDKKVVLFRPLLNTTRAQTHAYCAALGLTPRIDSSNASPEFLRNRIRLELMPLLEQMNPSMQAALLRLARNATQDSDYIRERAAAVWADVAQITGYGRSKVVALNTAALRHEHPAIQGYVLRFAIEAVGGEVTQRHILDATRLLNGAPGKMLNLPENLRFTTDYGKAFIGKADALDERLPSLPKLRGEFPLAVPGEVQAGAWRIRATVEELKTSEHEKTLADARKIAASAEWQDGTTIVETLDFDSAGSGLRIRARQAGDRFQPLGMAGSKSLRAFMIDARVPRRWREGLPLLVSERGIVCVPAWRIADWARITDSTKRVLRLEVNYAL